MSATQDEVEVASLLPYGREQLVQSTPHFSELRKSIEEQGVLVSLLVAGADCASPRGTVLSGGLRLKAAVDLKLPAVPVTFIDGLTADEEERQVLLGNIQANNRPMLPSEVWRCERRLAELEGKRQGQRTDLTGGSGGRTNEIVARITGATKNSIQTRDRVFSSGLVGQELAADIDAGTYKLSRVASALRAIERNWTGLSEALSKAVQQRTESEKELIEEAVGKLGDMLTPREEASPRSSSLTSAPLELSVERGAVEVTLAEEKGGFVGSSVLSKSVRVVVDVREGKATLTFEAVASDSRTSANINTSPENGRLATSVRASSQIPRATEKARARESKGESPGRRTKPFAYGALKHRSR